MSEKEVLALMYDFYNDQVLDGQNKDIPYYIKQIKKYRSKNLLIVGAGTGRVAIPLSNYANVEALDFDNARLELLKKKKELSTINADFMKYHAINKKYDMIIYPYSTLQFDNDIEKLDLFLKKMYEISNNDTIHIFDVSESFEYKPNKNHELLFKKYCESIKEDVEVYYSSHKETQFIEFIVEYYLTKSKKSYFEKEKYYYYNANLLLYLLKKNNMEILKVENGYEKDFFTHKHLYHCRKLK